MSARRSHLDWLESESIRILRVAGIIFGGASDQKQTRWQKGKRTASFRRYR